MSGHFAMAVKSRKKTHNEDVSHLREFNDGLMIAAQQNLVP